MTITGVPYADKALHYVRGCTKISPGCDHCYSCRLAAGRLRQSPPYQGLATVRNRNDPHLARPEWISKPRVFPEVLAEPLRRRQGKVWFVADMGDLFHGAVTFEEIAALFGVMAATRRHTYILLTKRADRMAEWYRWIAHESRDVGGPPAPCICGIEASNRGADVDYLGLPAEWPLPNVWPGTSCEDQKRLDERAPHLLSVPVHPDAGRLLSLEPQLGHIYADVVRIDDFCSHNVLTGYRSYAGRGGAPGRESETDQRVKLVIQGSEQLANGRNGRPFDMEWATEMHKRCTDAGAHYYLKQTPGPNGKVDKEPQLYGRTWRQLPWELRT